jgi:aryl-alcohol dehydrogenase-like predicted oxidoreductase
MMESRLPGYATPEGTQRFKTQFEESGKVAQGHFRSTPDGLSLTSLGMGSYLGDSDPDTDAMMTQAAIASLESGAINVLDAAINYRFQSSERSLGKAMSEMVQNGSLSRESVFVCSKNGFLTPDAAVPQDFRTYFTENFINKGIVRPEDIVGGMHCMSPSYLDDQLTRSLNNLGLETLDLMYLHNAAESQMPEVGQAVFMERLREAFSFYEQARRDNRIRYYGLATWSCFRVRPENEGEYLSIEAVVKLAEEVGGKAHGFRFIQLPYNLAYTEAFTLQNQLVEGTMLSTLEACTALGIGVFTSVPLMQGQLLKQTPPSFQGLETPAQFCLQFVRSTPGIIAPLIGHKSQPHVTENLRVATVSPLTAAQFEEVFSHP